MGELMTHASESVEEMARRLYIEGEFTNEHPNFDEADSPWKIQMILPFVDEFMHLRNWSRVRLLDVGGGAGLILRDVAFHIHDKYRIDVQKYALDLSPKALEIQRSRNPDMMLCLNEDIESTSFSDKEIDLAMMVDVIEHIPDPEKALEELKRIARYVILKVPLEDTIIFRLWNIYKRGDPRIRLIRDTGHVNLYTNSRIVSELEEHTGPVIKMQFANIFEYCLHLRKDAEDTKGLRGVKNRIASLLYAASPEMCSLVFPSDSVVLMVECR